MTVDETSGADAAQSAAGDTGGDGAAGDATPSNLADQEAVPGGDEAPRAAGDAGLADTPIGDLSKTQELRNAATHGLIGNVADNATFNSSTLVGGDQHLYLMHGAVNTQLRPGELTATIREQIEQAYVKPAGFEKFRTDIGDQRAVIVRGPAGRGKTAAAIRILIDRKVTKILLLRDAAKSLPTLIVEAGAGYILYDIGDPTGLTKAELDRIVPELDKANAHLFITMPSDLTLPDDGLAEHAHNIPDPPSHIAIVRSLLAFMVGTDELPPTLDGLDDLVAELLTATTPRRHAGELARVIDRQRRLENFGLDQVRAYMEGRIVEDFTIWFDQLPDLDTKCEAIALAAFNNLPFELVGDAARALKARLEPPEHIVAAEARLGRTSLRAAPDLATTRRDRLRILRAESAIESQLGPLGRTAAEVVRYIDPKYRSSVLRRAWTEYSVHDVLVAWLAEMCEHRHEAIRVWAATSLGMLTTFSFDYVVETVLGGWSRGSITQREAAAYALHVPASDADLRPAVRRLVRAWSNGNRAQQATAARVWGYTLGQDDPNSSMAELHRLARIDNLAIASAVSQSLADLYINHKFRDSEAVLAAILRWLRDVHRAPTAEMAFIRMARGLVMATESGAPVSIVTPTPRLGRRAAGPNRSFTQWPVLLHVAHGRRADQWLGLATIWRTILSETREVSGSPTGVLLQWARLVDNDPTGCEALADLLDTVADDRDMRRYLHDEAVLWKQNSADPPRNAIAAILSALKGRD